MPEEINRIATDSISDYYFITEQSAQDHLIFSGISEEKIFFVGNTMIDSLVKGLEKAELSSVLENYQLTPGEYILATLHRPSNVDNKQSLEDFYEVFQSISKNIKSKNIKIVFPIHPRTTSKLAEFGLLEKFKSLENLVMIPPSPYIDFLKLMKYSKLVMTDSGGIQEETTYLDVPCLTLRTTTERPITIEIGSNLLIQPEKNKIIDALDNSLKNPKKRIKVPLLWDGQAASRIVKIIENKILQFTS
jgi:UDP-N-acetylglucosamine 2-epimerase (non-hydrolysing)